jgi:haloalkane dehalogenase
VLPPWLDRHEYPFEPKQVAGLSVVDEGSGPVVVFSHGTPTWSFEWRHLIKGLRATHRCIAPDHLGFGLSPRPSDADYSPQAHAQRFTQVIDALQLERYSLIVHDFGGPIALDSALDRPERIERLVILNSIAWPFTADPRMRRMASLAGTGLFRFLYRHLNLSFLIGRSAWGAAPRPAAMWAQYTSCFSDADSRERVLWALAKSLEGSTAFFETLWARRARLAQTPIHFIWGMADTAFTPAVLGRFREAWPHASVTELPNAGHWPHEEEPQRCVEEVRAFL